MKTLNKFAFVLTFVGLSIAAIGQTVNFGSISPTALTQSNMDGKFEEFHTSLNYNNLNVSTSYPNPFKTTINVNLFTKNNVSEITRANIYCSHLYQRSFNTSKSMTIGTQNLVPGIYFLSKDGVAQKMIT